VIADGSRVLRWAGDVEFLVSPEGTDIWYRSLISEESLPTQPHLAGALSFALLRRGHDPIHATCIVVEGRAAALIGSSGAGKSTLAAAFIARGHRLLTDDLMVVGSDRRGGFLAQPGMATIKLWPDSARSVPDPRRRDGDLVDARAEKLSFPIDHSQRQHHPTPLAAMYVVERVPSHEIGLAAISQREGFLRLTENTFNTRVVDAERLERHLAATSALVRAVPMRSLTYPSDFRLLPEVVEAIIADLP
jgi:hypothetical protein